MPAALDIDREQVQMLALTYGVREAARRLNIPESTVQAWSARNGWFADIPNAKPIVPRVQPVATVSPVKVLMESMRDDALKGRAASLKVTRRALESIDKECSDADLRTKDVADVVHSYVKSAATAGGYAASDAVVKLNLGVTSNQGQTIEAEVVQDAGSEELP